jgi:hypothetical protein
LKDGGSHRYEIVKAPRPNPWSRAEPEREPSGSSHRDKSVTRVPMRVFRDAEALGEALAGEILARYHVSGGSFLLGCPGLDEAARP